MHAEVNTIAPYLFGRLLHDSFSRATVLSVTTGAINNVGALDVGELAHPSAFRKIVGPYADSELATVALMDAFAREYPDTTFRSAEPGAVKTPMTVGDGMPGLLVPIRNGALVIRDKVRDLPANAADPDVQADLLAWCRELTGV